MKTFNALPFGLRVMSALFSACSKDVAGRSNGRNELYCWRIYNSDQKVASG